MSTKTKGVLMGSRVVRAAAVGLIAALLHACSAQGDSAQVTTNGNGTAHTNSAAAPVIDVNITPTQLDAGGSVTATWTSQNASSCNANGAWSGNVALNNTSGDLIGPLAAGTYTYGVSCTGAGGTTAVAQTVEVGAVPAPVISLTLTPVSLQPGNSATLVWTTTNATSCVGTGGTGTDGWASNRSTSNTGFSTGSITAAGSYAYNLTCTGPGGSSEVSKDLVVSASATAPPPTISGFAASSTQIQPNQSTTFSWSSNATSCAASGGSGSDGWSGSEPTSSTSTVVGPIAAAGRYSYTLTCSGAGGNSASTISVLVTSSTTTPPVTVTLGVLPLQIVAGNAAALTWSTTNANTCTASGSWNGSKPLLGNAVPTRVLTAAGVYTFTLTCAGNNGTSGNGTATLTVNPAPASIGSFSAASSAIATGQSTTLSWNSTGATSCSASGGSGSDNWTGSVGTSNAGFSVGPISTAGTYTYSLDCSGPGGSSTPQSVNLTVTSASTPAATVTNLVSTPASVQAGNTVSLSWGSSNATSCNASGGLGTDGWTGSVGTASLGTIVGPFTSASTYTYTLTCSGPGGTGPATSVAINVSAVATPPATVATFTATPSTIDVNQASTLAWTSNAATSCTASSSSGNWSGSVPIVSSGVTTGAIVSPGSYTYTLLCTGPGGTGSPSSVTLNVINPSGSAPSIGSFTAASTNLSTGQGTTLSWSATNATSCTESGGSGTDSWGGTVGTSSGGTGIGPFNTAGTYTYTLNCSGTGGTSSGPSSVTINVSSPPAQATVTSFVATPSSFQAGGSALLAWTSNGATSCAASNGSGSWTGSVGTSSLGTSTGTITTAGTYTYTLTCSGAAGAGPASSVILNVTSAPPPAPSISSFSASPNSVVVGSSTTLAWSSSSATSCNASGGTGSDGWAGSVGTSSTGFTTNALTPAGTYIYTLNCTGSGGSSSQSVTLDVTAAPPSPTIYAFNVTPSTAEVGQYVTATWSTANATTCTASGGTGTDTWAGSVGASSTGTPIGPVTPAGNYTYTLTCNGSGGNSAPSSAGLTVTTAPVPPSIGSFSASPIAIQTGGSTTLSWTSTNATGCTAGGGTGTWGGAVGTSNTGTTVGPINTAGTYNFTLSCSGAGGTSATSAAIVTVTTAIPAASIVSFAATPTTITAGGSALLSWVSSGASACTASGGTGSDGWNGTQATNSVGETVGPLNAAGVYIYTLNCTGPGGASSPVSVTVTVNAAAPAPTVGSFGAAPSTITVGQTSQLAWTTSNATSCTAGGGTGGDGWSGTQAPSSTGTTVGPFTTTGTITYTLTCTGAGGTSSAASTSVTVNAATPQQPSVSLQANGHTTLTATIGTTITMSWTSSSATSCAASGGAGTAGSDNWSGNEATSSSGLALGAVTTPGTYTYTLTCSGTGGSGSSTVKVTYVSANSSDCGLPGIPTTSLVAPAATASNTIQGACVGCTVLNQNNVINSATNSPAVIAEVASLSGGDVVLQVSQTSATFPAGRTVGFILTSGTSLLSLSLLENVTLTTYLNGALQQVASTNNNLLTLQALGLISVNSDAGFAGFTATKPFNQVAVQVNQLAGLLTTVNVYRACVSLQ